MPIPKILKRMERITIISNLEHEDARTEDTALARLIARHFNAGVEDLFDDSLFSKDGFFLIRNVWGRANGRERMGKIYTYFQKNNIPHSNQFIGKGDQQGKNYLVTLFEQGYPVIPTFNNNSLAAMYGAEEYLAKPVYGGSGKGIFSLSPEELHKHIDTNQYIIQPKIAIASELSFFFIDNRFHHALKTIKERWDLQLFTPTSTELAIAQKFVDWNPIQGIQRIDFAKTTEGTLLLLEVEDWCPYLSLLDVKKFPTESFISTLVQSIK